MYGGFEDDVVLGRRVSGRAECAEQSGFDVGLLVVVEVLVVGVWEG